MDYMVTNCLISTIALITYALLNNAPARLRFYVVVAALISWFIPWEYVATIKLLSDTSAPFTNELFNLSQLLLRNSSPAGQEVLPLTPVITAQADHTWLSLLTVSKAWLLLTAIGILMFCAKVTAYFRLLYEYKMHAEKAEHLWQQFQFEVKNVALYVTQNCDLAMATGIRKPQVWISDTLLNSTELKSVLAHELNHVKQHDPAWMWFITFAHSVFWWNPLIRLLVCLARHNIELSCDERCQQQLNHDYRRDLATLFLHGQTSAARAVMPITHFRNFNVYRIKHLSKETKMKARYIVVSIFGLTLSSLAAATISDSYQTATAKSEQAQITTQQTRKKIPIHNGNALHNQQIDELLRISENAKSHEPEILNDVYNNVVSWYENRADTDDLQSEYSVKIMSFSMMSYLLEKLQRPQEILKVYDDMFAGVPLKRVLFLQHHRAIALMELGSPSQSIELLEQVIDLQPQAKPGTLLLLAQAYLQSGDGENVIRVAEQLETVGEITYLTMQALNYKRAGYEALGESQKASEMQQLLTERYGRTAWQPETMGMASPLLAFLPESV